MTATDSLGIVKVGTGGGADDTLGITTSGRGKKGFLMSPLRRSQELGASNETDSILMTAYYNERLWRQVKPILYNDPVIWYQDNGTNHCYLTHPSAHSLS